MQQINLFHLEKEEETILEHKEHLSNQAKALVKLLNKEHKIVFPYDFEVSPHMSLCDCCDNYQCPFYEDDVYFNKSTFNKKEFLFENPETGKAYLPEDGYNYVVKKYPICRFFIGSNEIESKEMYDF